MERTRNYEQALIWAANLGAEGIVPTVWIPRSAFISAAKSADGSVSFTRDGFGLGIGNNPIIEEDWERFALPKRLEKAKTAQYKLVNRWNPYQISTSGFTELFGVEKIKDDGIADYLKANAPDSSTYPGSDEIQFWAGLRIDGDLKALGCVAKWESGEMVISSVATKLTERGKGYGSRLTRGILALGNLDQIKVLTLAVNAKNEIAAKMYEKIGFQSLGEFNTFERAL